MGRSPCCVNSGLKKGPWSAEEDRALAVFIGQNGHGNWRALPKRAGLMRCGKSCRLRWMNYLRPDIKRGNFSMDEEEMIIKLHQELGNKWSIIAARLPGRTDNEIKNVWNTHLKKKTLNLVKSETKTQQFESYFDFDPKVESSPEPTTSSVSTVVDGGSDDFNLMEMGETFWSEVFTGEEWSGVSGFSSGDSDSQHRSSASDFDTQVDNDFWQNVFCKPELFQF